MYDLLETPANLTLIRKITNLSVYVERWIDKRTYRVLKFRGNYMSVPERLTDAEIGTQITHRGGTEGKFHNGNFHDVFDPQFDPVTTKKFGYCAWYHMNGMLYKEPFFVDGVEHGMGSIYYRDGKPMEEGMMDHGKRVGTWMFYNQSGENYKHEIY